MFKKNPIWGIPILARLGNLMKVDLNYQWQFTLQMFIQE